MPAPRRGLCAGPPRQQGVDVVTAGGDGAHGVEQFGRPALLQHVTGGAGGHQLLDERLVVVPGQRDDAPSFGNTCWIAFAAARPFISGIEISRMTTCGCVVWQCLTASSAIGRFGDDLDVGLRVEQQPQPLADRFVILGEQDANRGHGSMLVESARRRVTDEDRRALAGAGFELELRADQPGALAHPEQADAALARRVFRIEADAVILDDQDERTRRALSSSTSTRLACACLATLVSASWAMR